jgi:radical SAM superfamily enzyme YgiQ (UPF0313 family)
MRVALVNPHYPSGTPQAIFIPLGISYLAAVLEKKGYEVNVVDCQTLRPTQEVLESKFRELQPDVVGVTSATLTFEPAVEIVQAAKKTCPNCVTLMGGPHVTVTDEQTLLEHPEVDIVVRGEGENTVLEIAQLIEQSNLKSLSNVLGITFRKNEKIVHTADRPFIENIDTLPFPAHKYFDLNNYRIGEKTYLPIITSRGCPFQCAFCLASRMCGKRFRARSPKTVVDELEWLRDSCGVDAFSFYDDTFTFDRKRAVEICHEMRNRKINLPWDCRTRVDQVTTELLAELKKANCQLVHFGVESGSQEMLDIMRKGTTVEQNAKAIKLAKKAGIAVAISIVVGYPGETPAMLQETREFIRRTKPDYLYICEAVPYPGTELYSVIKNLGWKMDTDWRRYHEQTMVFKNPQLPIETIEEAKKAIYDDFFSFSYFLRQSMKRGFYTSNMSKMALNHLVARRMPKWMFSVLRKLAGRRKAQGGHNIPAEKNSD